VAINCYCNWLIAFDLSAPHWFKDIKEVATSTLSPGCMDLPIDAGLWLKIFRAQNLHLLSQLDVRVSWCATVIRNILDTVVLQLKTTKEYVWNQRETSPQGISILEFVDFGINRVKYACGVVEGLLKELKQFTIAGKCKTMVVIDGFNAFTSSHTRVMNEKKMMMLPKQITLARSFYDMIKNDWCNGAVVLSVDTLANKVCAIICKSRSYSHRFSAVKSIKIRHAYLIVRQISKCIILQMINPVSLILGETRITSTQISAWQRRFRIFGSLCSNSSRWLFGYGVRKHDRILQRSQMDQEYYAYRSKRIGNT